MVRNAPYNRSFAVNFRRPKTGSVTLRKCDLKRPTSGQSRRSRAICLTAAFEQNESQRALLVHLAKSCMRAIARGKIVSLIASDLNEEDFFGHGRYSDAIVGGDSAQGLSGQPASWSDLAPILLARAFGSGIMRATRSGFASTGGIAIAPTGKKSRDVAVLDTAQTRAVSAAILSTLLIIGIVVLFFSTRFRDDYFSRPLGVPYPDWTAFTPPSADESYYEGEPDCKGVSDENILCALFRARAPGQGSKEVAAIQRAIGKDQASTYCDPFFGSCARQQANITLSDARRVIRYLNEVYLHRARADTLRGRLASAQSAVARIRYLINPIDLPLGSEGCCDDANMLYISSAFLSDVGRWRDRKYALAVLYMLDDREPESGEVGLKSKSGEFADIDYYVSGLKAADEQCYRVAAGAFAALAITDERIAVRELAAYMALLSNFRERNLASTAPTCKVEQPEPLSDVQRDQLKSLVGRAGLVSDIAQMDAPLPISAGAPDAR
jgi:hypothetical protein